MNPIRPVSRALASSSLGVIAVASIGVGALLIHAAANAVEIAF